MQKPGIISIFSVLPSWVIILTSNGNHLEDDRYDEGTDLRLICSVTGGKESNKFYLHGIILDFSKRRPFLRILYSLYKLFSNNLIFKGIGV